jgi:nucleolar protein 53
LSSELKSGSLRTIRPKGSLVTDRMASFLDRDMAPKKQLKRKQRVQGKLRKSKIKVRGKGFEASKEGHILG